ncbi:ester cyclase [Neisseria sp.]|uniref:ester cyclase n=1 Tax=Neisseria sp. TaxID=192066 RepID=UPI0035A0CB69
MTFDIRSQISRFETAINTADEALMNELVDASAPFYTPASPEPLYGAEGFLALIRFMREGFPDIRWKLEETVAETDKIAVRWTCSGTHQGTFMGVPPTGKRFSVGVMNFYDFNSEGKIIRDTAAEGMIGIFRAIGLLP